MNDMSKIELDDLFKAVKCLASSGVDGSCYEEFYNLTNGSERMSCNGSIDGTIPCPYHQNSYDVCFEDGDCGEWLDVVADLLGELQQYKERIEQLKHAEVLSFKCKLPDGRICHFSDFIEFLQKGQVE